MNRPALRYYGGKWRLAPWVIQHLPKHTRYVEPFCGAASVLMRKPRAKIEVINDLCSEVVEYFKVLRDPEMAKKLQQQAELTPFSREEFANAYIKTNDPVENARRLLVRSFMSYGSSGIFKQVTGFRGNCSVNKPSSAEWAGFPRHLPAFTERLKGVVIENKKASEIITSYDSKDTLFYLDPPYVHSTHRDQSHKYKYEMTDDNHREISEQLHNCKGMVIISGYPSGLYDDLYNGWYQVSRSHVANCQKMTVECLWISPNAIKQPAFDFL